MKQYKYFLAMLFIISNSIRLDSQQITDSLYKVEIPIKTYPNQNGTTIHIDEGHNNFHTKDGRYYSFAQVLESDGYLVTENNGEFNENTLEEIEILVIANALPDGMSSPVVRPTSSAFSSSEIQELKKWVSKGGSLFIIADHMPFAGAAAELAKVFDIDFYDSFVLKDSLSGIIDFAREKRTLSSHPITKGRNLSEEVKQVRTYTGQGFQIPENATSILNLDESQSVYLVDTMWVFNDNVKSCSAKGFSQGAIMEFGKGKIAVWGEAAMFTAQLAGPDQIKIGMNTAEAKENHQLLLNIIHWLDGKLETKS